MATRGMIVLSLAVLVAVAGAAAVMRGSFFQGSGNTRLVWTAFLYGMPVLLAGLVLAGQRWALMACVMYATIGLALDIATVVQDLTAPAVRHGASSFSGLTAFVNFLLIVLGGREFLYGDGAPMPRSSLPPNPPSPPSS